MWGDLSLAGSVDFSSFPRTRAEFVALMKTVDDETRALMLNLAPSFDALYDAMENTGSANDALTESYTVQIELLQEQQSAYKALQSSIKSLINNLKDDIKDLRKVDIPLDEMRSAVFAEYDVSNVDEMQERVTLAEEYREAILSTLDEQIAAIELQIDAIEGLKDAGQDLLDLVAELQFDRARTTSTIPEQFSAMLTEWNRLSVLAPTDEASASALADLTPQLLDLAKIMFGGTANDQYANLFGLITGKLTELGTTMVELDTEDLLQDIIDLEKDAALALEELATFLEENMLTDVESMLGSIEAQLEIANERLDALSGDNGVTFDILGALNSALALWSAPTMVELNEPTGGIAGPAPEVPTPAGEAQPASETTLHGLYTVMDDAFGSNGRMWAANDPFGFDGYSEGGISNVPAVFGEAGPEAAVPLPDGRTIPVTLTSPIASSDGSYDESLVVQLKEMQLQNAFANNELVEQIKELQEEISRLKQNVGDPIVEAISTESRGHSKIYRVG
jgi:hypothetical protein